jgi:hypothetical protein
VAFIVKSQLKLPLTLHFPTFSVTNFATQVVTNTVLLQAFPDDPIVGEEDTVNLYAGAPESNVLHTCVVELADDVLVQLPSSHAGEHA